MQSKLKVKNLTNQESRLFLCDWQVLVYFIGSRINLRYTVRDPLNTKHNCQYFPTIV